MYGYFWIFVIVVLVYLGISFVFRMVFLNSFKNKKNEDGTSAGEPPSPNQT